MQALTRTVGTVAATALVTSGLTGVAGAAHPTTEPTARLSSDTAVQDSGLEELVGLVISGVGEVGETLSVAQPTDVLGIASWKVEWLGDGAVIPGATDWTYVPVPADAGRELRARVTGLTLFGLPLAQGLTSALPISLPGGEPGEEPAGQLTAVFDQVLTEVGGRLGIQRPTWSEQGVLEAVQWFRDEAGAAVPIPGATGWDYLPVGEDAGSEVFARITGTLAGFPVVDLATSRFAVPAEVLTAETPTSIDSSEGRGTGDVLTAKEPGWNLEDVATTYQWQLDGIDITGADQASYPIRPGDVGKQLTVVATGTKEGVTAGTSTSAPVTAVLGDPVAATAKPSIRESDVDYGETLTASPGAWGAGATPTFTYRWLRNGTEEVGTGPTYDVQLADVTAQLSVVVTAVREGYAPGAASSSPVTVDKLLATTKAKLKRARIRKGQAAVLRISTRSVGYGIPGKVTIFDGRKKVRTVKVGSTAKTVRIKVRRVGRHTLRVVHPGNQYVERSAKAVRLVVKRAGR